MDCKYCGAELPTESNPRRAFCNDAHKQAYWRQQHQADQSAAQLAEVEALRATVREQAQEIQAQAEEITRLRTLLDMAYRCFLDVISTLFSCGQQRKRRMISIHRLRSRLSDFVTFVWL